MEEYLKRIKFLEALLASKDTIIKLVILDKLFLINSLNSLILELFQLSTKRISGGGSLSDIPVSKHFSKIQNFQKKNAVYSIILKKNIEKYHA